MGAPALGELVSGEEEEGDQKIPSIVPSEVDLQGHNGQERSKVSQFAALHDSVCHVKTQWQKLGLELIQEGNVCEAVLAEGVEARCQKRARGRDLKRTAKSVDCPRGQY